MHFKEIFNKTSFKFVIGFIAIISVGLAGLYFSDRLLNQEKYEAKRYLEDLERQYKEDTYGGKTPEETLQMFIDALKAGDIELASKYFVVDEREEWRGKLEKIKERELINDMIFDLERYRERKMLSDGRATFYIYNDSGQLAVVIDTKKGPNGIWKIIDM